MNCSMWILKRRESGREVSPSGHARRTLIARLAPLLLLGVPVVSEGQFTETNAFWTVTQGGGSIQSWASHNGAKIEFSDWSPGTTNWANFAKNFDKIIWQGGTNYNYQWGDVSKGGFGVGKLSLPYFYHQHYWGPEYGYCTLVKGSTAPDQECNSRGTNSPPTWWASSTQKAWGGRWAWNGSECVWLANTSNSNTPPAYPGGPLNDHGGPNGDGWRYDSADYGSQPWDTGPEPVPRWRWPGTTWPSDMNPGGSFPWEDTPSNPADNAPVAPTNFPGVGPISTNNPDQRLDAAAAEISLKALDAIRRSVDNAAAGAHTDAGTVGGKVDAAASTVAGAVGSASSSLGGKLDSLNGNVNAGFANLGGKLDTANGHLSDLKGALSGSGDEIATWQGTTLGGMGSDWSNQAANVGTALAAVSNSADQWSLAVSNAQGGSVSGSVSVLWSLVHLPDVGDNSQLSFTLPLSSISGAFEDYTCDFNLDDYPALGVMRTAELWLLVILTVWAAVVIIRKGIA